MGSRSLGGDGGAGGVGGVGGLGGGRGWRGEARARRTVAHHPMSGTLLTSVEAHAARTAPPLSATPRHEGARADAAVWEAAVSGLAA